MKAYLKIPLGFLAAAAAAAVTLTAVVIGGYYYVAPSLPTAEELRDVRMQVPLQIYSRDGRLIQEFGEVKRTPIAYEDIPQLLIDAVLAAEDYRFFEHPGVDYQGIIRAVMNELSGGDRNIGGSTITQQVARTLNLVSRERLYVRKFKEWILALRLEREFTKQQILELYLNSYFFGHSSYGVVTAARTYFGKDLHDLTVSETAIIAGIPQGPSILNPLSSPERATSRRAYVLRRMLETSAITDAQYRAALAEPVVAKRYGLRNQLYAPYVAEMVRSEMVRRFGPAAYTAGLRVTTTIDSRLQSAANNGIRQALLAYDERHGYRGPLARVELDEDAMAAGEAHWREVLDDYPSVLDYETALVLAADEASARLYVRGGGEQTIGMEAVSWARRYVNDEVVGARPTTVTEVLAPGDIVRFRVNLAGEWRLSQIPEVQGAFVSMDPRDGAIAALTGGFDFFLSNFNRATQSRRQPGSSFKPFIYSAALAHGLTPATIVNDAPPNLGYDPVLERVWRPENFGAKYHGETRLRYALVESMNAAAIRVLQQVGAGKAAPYVRKFGFDSVAVPENLSLALGAGGVAPVDLVNGYTAFANGGFRVENYVIDRIEDANGDVLYQAKPAIACSECATEPPLEPGMPKPALIESVTELYPPMRLAPPVITPQNAYLISDMLRDVVRLGTGNRARRELGRNDLAGKTGTTNDGRDTWFVGFNPGIVAAAWVGFDQDRPLGGNEQGGVTAIPMWIEFMRDALEGVPEREFVRPPGIVEYRINPNNGLIASDATVNSVFEKFEIDNIPEREPDPVYSRSLDPFSPPAPSGAGDIF